MGFRILGAAYHRNGGVSAMWRASLLPRRVPLKQVGHAQKGSGRMKRAAKTSSMKRNRWAMERLLHSDY